jgi:hypothetical protein
VNPMCRPITKHRLLGLLTKEVIHRCVLVANRLIRPECWWLMSQPTAVSLCSCAFSTPFYWLIGLQPRINRSILGPLLWHSDVTKGHWQTLTEPLPVTGAYGVNIW